MQDLRQSAIAAGKQMAQESTYAKLLKRKNCSNIFPGSARSLEVNKSQ